MDEEMSPAQKELLDGMQEYVNDLRSGKPTRVQFVPLPGSPAKPNSKKRYKVLPVSENLWATVRIRPANREISPVFRRDGWYHDRYSGVTWVERGGKAWLYQGGWEDFARMLWSLEPARSLDDWTLAAMRDFSKRGLLSPVGQDQLNKYQTAARNRELAWSLVKIPEIRKAALGQGWGGPRG